MAEVYDTDRFAVLYYAGQNPPLANLGLAARYLIRLFGENNVPAAFLGGWAVFLRGSGRRTNDVDMTVGCTMTNLMALLSLQDRLLIPQTHGVTCVQVFVQTGGSWDNGYNEVAVSVDIIINGNLGTPANLPNGTESIQPVETTQGNRNVRVIDLYHQFSSKLSAFYDRQSENDYVDLTFLITSNTEAIYSLRTYLDLQHRHYYFGVFASRNPTVQDNVSYMRQLLGLA